MRIGWFVVSFLLVTLGCGGLEAEDQAPTSDEDAQVSIITESTKGVAEVERNGVVAVDAGFAADGVQIEIPDGFLSTECKFTAALSSVEGSALSVSVSISNTGVVSCRRLVQEREDVPPEFKGCVASYTVVCVDNE